MAITQAELTAGKNIRRIMADREISYKDLGQMIDIHPTTLGNKLTGHGILRKSEVMAIASVFEVDPDELYAADNPTQDAGKPETQMVEIQKELFARQDELKDNLADLSIRLSKTAQQASEVHALSALITALTELCEQIENR